MNVLCVNVYNEEKTYKEWLRAIKPVRIKTLELTRKKIIGEKWFYLLFCPLFICKDN
jgi:hypothetical protein